MKVTLREKAIKNGKLSLYLDFYPPIENPDTKTTTRREFLGLYLYENPKTDTERKHNKETKRIAETVRAQRQLEIQAGKFDFIAKNKKQIDFLAYFLAITEQKKDSAGNHGNWVSAYHYLKDFTKGKCDLSEVNEPFCVAFKEYLQNVDILTQKGKKLSQNAAVSYFNKFRAALNLAYQEKLITDNPNVSIKAIKQADTQREFLSLNELQTLAKTECEDAELKNAALFSALTGLRFSDIQKLKWEEVCHDEINGFYLRFTQKKTKSVETLFIAENAYKLLGERENAQDKVFQTLHYSANQNVKLARWVLKAGITKKITFHCFRHTFATLQISLGTDIYTVSKMLGHKEISTTQIYAKIIDKKKQDAANLINIEL
jgi:integrase